ncbi:MAG: sodium:proton antiporter [Gammaproteobacteria bacterium]|nr:sodium:proton antiporter [Gammaproteobacteria bacterium]MBU2256557.1 sodium:proton antiporter [Gammaproteobacteria bacterium]
MTIALAWLALLALFALATWVGKRLRLIPIVSQLLLATLGLPLLMLWSTPLGFGANELLAPAWLEPLYGVAFCLLLGHILSDVVDLQLEPGSLQIALPSFFVPFFCGLACAFWLLPEQSGLATIAVGLLFALTAIPVLFLYLQHLGYPVAKIRQLLQAAIIMDVLCWLIFGLAQGSSNPATLLWPLLAAGLPLLLKLLPLRSARLNGGCFLALLLLMQQLHLNALVFGIAYLLLLTALRLPLRLPLPAGVLRWLQTWLAVPLILAFGLLQIDWQNAWQAYSAWQFAALLLLPIISKLAGNWLGLSWAAGQLRAYAGQWRESLLLNTRGLTEIIFLNLLLQQQIISPALYFALMLMGLISTLLPALAGAYPNAVMHEARSRYEVS